MAAPVTSQDNRQALAVDNSRVPLTVRRSVLLPGGRMTRASNQVPETGVPFDRPPRAMPPRGPLAPDPSRPSRTLSAAPTVTTAPIRAADRGRISGRLEQLAPACGRCKHCTSEKCHSRRTDRRPDRSRDVKSCHNSQRGDDNGDRRRAEIRLGVQRPIMCRGEARSAASWRLEGLRCRPHARTCGIRDKTGPQRQGGRATASSVACGDAIRALQP